MQLNTPPSKLKNPKAVQPAEVTGHTNYVHTFISKVNEFAAVFGTMVKTLVTPSVTPKALNEIYLPETVSYAIKYREAQFGKDEVVAMLQPGNQGVGLYLALKYLDNFPVDQQNALGKILEVISQAGDYDKIDLALLELLESLKAEPFQKQKISGSKVLKFYTQGYKLLEDNFQKLADQIAASHHIPVLLCYAGTIGLKPFLQSLKPDKSLILLNPKKTPHSSTDKSVNSGFGYVIKRNEQGFECKILEEDQDFRAACQGKQVILVDDTKYTGSTIKNTRKLFEDHSWPKIAGELFIVSK